MLALSVSARPLLLLGRLSRLVCVLRMCREESALEFVGHVFVLLSDLAGLRVPRGTQDLSYVMLAYACHLSALELTNFVVGDTRVGLLHHSVALLAVQYVRVGRSGNLRLLRFERRNERLGQ